ncbi:MAG: hypothetical protein Q8R38_05890 [Candidatus Omnitrophota bacterium]|nr:hypothetical protein [Candidatus Omnitrophota bacterium]
MVEYIKSKRGSLIAIILPSRIDTKGATFFTPPEFSQQVGLLRHRKGAQVKPHVHKLVKRRIERTQEVLHVKKGKVAVYLYDEKERCLGTRILKKGDTILLASGGHGVEVLKDSLMLEIKQGPYAGVDDKEYFKEKNGR